MDIAAVPEFVHIITGHVTYHIEHLRNCKRYYPGLAGIYTGAVLFMSNTL
jgi:hypothetical protein